ncbi:MAG: hypothetical protein CMJ19_21945 [Phycisphaeraceae bacterium]|nr:hypothetical protein [Phycisphaeraceae bacterium]
MLAKVDLTVLEASSLDMIWVLLCSALVMLMQAGFCCLESGLCRTKNNINVALKNLMDYCITGMVFWAVGFWLMFGSSEHGLIGLIRAPIGDDASPALLTFFLFQVTFAGTSATIISGAVAERVRFSAYAFTTLVIGALVYPIIGHWCWGGAFTGTNVGWLQKMGFVDFAGSTVVHSVGGWVSLAALIIIGPRKGRFGAGAKPIQASNVPMAVLGVMILWFGWFGFNGGSTLGVSDQIPRIMVNTSLAAAAGSCAMLAIAFMSRAQPTVDRLINGVVAGLVAITAGCHVVSPFSAVIIGAVGGMVCSFVTQLLIRCRIDDVIGAVPAHAGAGVWGTLAVALFGNPELIGTGLSWTQQLLVQFTGVTSAFVWAFGVGMVVLYSVDRITPLRVQAEDEIKGLNVAEHGASSELFDLMSQMNHHRVTGNLNQSVDIDPNSEIGRIGMQYNAVIQRINQDQRVMQTASREIAKMNQELVAARSKDQKQSQIKSQFLAHLEKEIRKPMEIIQQHNDQMRENHSSDSTCMQYIDQIEDDSKHLLHLLDDIMHLTALNSDDFKLHETKVPIRDLLEEVSKKYASQAAAKHIEMQTQIGPNVPMMIFADEDRLRQILDHLVHNAVRYTKQGYVHIMAKAIPQGEYNMILRLTVEDSGIGIKPELQEQIFNPFCKLSVDHEAELLAEPAGTGMGLTICRRLAWAMRGNLTVGSVPGQGSVFCLTIATRADRPVVPLPEWNKDDSGEYELSSIDLSGKRILYVEDQYDMQKLMQKIMHKVGAKVDLADNGKVGMEIALAAWKTGRPYDMLIVDRCMPVMDGITAVTRLREQGFAQPILLLSANASNDREKCLAAGCSALLTKPVDRDMLLRMTHKFLSRQPAAQPV